MRARCGVALGVVVLLTAACTGAEDTADPAPRATASPTGAASSGSPAPSTPAATPSVPPRADPDDVRPVTAVRAVRHLAGAIGPRMATGPAYRRAARWVAEEFDSLGYEVRREVFDVPAGTSWGIPVDAGRSLNVIATPAGFDPAAPHLLVGAHLDTVPQAPGAEDNASGVGALLAVAEAIADRETRLPVVLVAFGAEEPRGPSDDEHHYGSRHHVAQLSSAQRDALRGMLSLDRVGVGDVMPACSAGEPDRALERLLAAARRVGAEVAPCSGNRSSDHWSFAREGLPGLRLGSTPYAGYHSAGDVPAVVQRDQLARAARIAVSWVRGR